MSLSALNVKNLDTSRQTNFSGRIDLIDLRRKVMCTTRDELDTSETENDSMKDKTCMSSSTSMGNKSKS